ncbi:SGNH/GDSL hydrolase family protein [Psychromicrobium xiongbiense]|uniref:SGNH/GDSL hydrolase family protein n=1 Tax=Psychromicrobium xiongbiense TaxID=3051184 RepID=UPI002552B6C0|nr:SGNH/GDSL hydrolase family protein [Psychromicrobium sp. YIM S02556]
MLRRPWLLSALAAALVVLTLLFGQSLGRAAGAPLAGARALSTLISPDATTLAGDGARIRNPLTNRVELVRAGMPSTAVLIGDSQCAGAAGIPGDHTWPQMALTSLGYSVSFHGVPGTGYVAANSRGQDYPDALLSGQWVLPYAGPRAANAPLVVIEGGGNDAALGATDAQITANAQRLVTELRRTYPASAMVMIGTLGRGENFGGGRRSQVDGLLKGFAATQRIPFVSVGDWLTRYNVAQDLADAVHLNETGHRILAQVLRNAFITAGIVGPAGQMQAHRASLIPQP